MIIDALPEYPTLTVSSRQLERTEWGTRVSQGRTFAIGLLTSLCAIIAVTNASAEDWPQLQHDAGHTGYTADQPQPPFRLKWIYQIQEPTATASPPIVAAGKVFLGTNWGNVIALDRHSGKPVWVYRTEGPVIASPAYHDGTVYVTSMDRRCHAVDAATGQLRWKFEIGEGLSTAPVVADGKVFLTGRDGWAYAVRTHDGRLLWKANVESMVMATPAYDQGVLFVGSGDQHIYALDGKTGGLRWRSDQLPGAAIRDYWLVAAQGTVIASTQLVYGAHPTYRQLDEAVMRPFRESHSGQMLVQDDLIEKVRQWFVDHPHQQTLHVLDAATGKRKFVAPIVPVHGGGCVGPLPAIGPDGQAYLVYANVRLQASGWAFPGKLDLETGKLVPLIQNRYWIDADQWEWQPRPGTRWDRHSPFAVGFCVNDQSWGVALAGQMLLTVRDPGWQESEGAYGYIDLITGEDGYWSRDSNRLRNALRDGRFGGAFHATCSPPVISDRHVFHKAVRNVVFCFEGS